MSVSNAPDAASDAKYGPSRRTSPWSLFSSITITTWAGRDAAPAGVAGAISPDVDEGTVVASGVGAIPRAQEGAAPTAPTIRNAARARTGRRVTDPILPAAQPGGPADENLAGLDEHQ